MSGRNRNFSIAAALFKAGRNTADIAAELGDPEWTVSKRIYIERCERLKKPILYVPKQTNRIQSAPR